MHRSIATLKVEDEPQILQPSIELLLSAIDRMRPTGPAFVIVERGHDYAQAGGGDGEFSVEWRQYGEPFIHLIAGMGPESEETHIVKMHYGHTKVQKHEVLGINEVKELLGGFLLDGKRPVGYVWRDVSYAFRPQQSSDDIAEL